MEGFEVDSVKQSVGREYIMENHYTGGCGAASMTWGLYDWWGDLRGVAAFQTPISENVRKAVFGEGDCWCSDVDGDHGFHQHVTELHRLATDDDLPPTTTSWFVSQALDRLKEYKPKYWAVISHADSTEGHDGTVYQATNAVYTGMAGGNTYYRKPDGTLKPPRNGGENISVQEARERGWEVESRDGKHRYLFFLDNGKRHKRWIENNLQYEQLPYPSTVEDGGVTESEVGSD